MNDEEFKKQVLEQFAAMNKRFDEVDSRSMSSTSASTNWKADLADVGENVRLRFMRGCSCTGSAGN